MTYKELKNNLKDLTQVVFELENKTRIPAHFHITEMGYITKHFIDCGNQIRKKNSVSFQLWHAEDYEHRLTPETFQKIIQATEPLIKDAHAPIEVEYMASGTIGKYTLDLIHDKFILIPTATTCLAKDHCGIPVEKTKISLRDFEVKNTCCSTQSSCC